MALTTLMHFGVYCLNQLSVLSSGLPSRMLPQALLGAGNVIIFPASGVAVSVQTAPCCDSILETFFLSLVSELCVGYAGLGLSDLGIFFLLLWLKHVGKNPRD